MQRSHPVAGLPANPSIRPLRLNPTGRLRGLHPTVGFPSLHMKLDLLDFTHAVGLSALTLTAGFPSSPTIGLQGCTLAIGLSSLPPMVGLCGFDAPVGCPDLKRTVGLSGIPFGFAFHGLRYTPGFLG